MKTAAAVHPMDRLPIWARAALGAAGGLLLLGVLVILPIKVPAYLDFQVLYQSNMGLLRGVALYDHAGLVNLIADLAQVTPEQVRVLPFPYPPWYALVTLWLAWLPIGAAARVWFGISLVLLVVSTWLLSEGWPPIKRLAAAVLAVFCAPVLGSLAVGQYGFPVLLGCALMIHALRHASVRATACAAALLTFKPHLGGLILLAVLVHLWQRKDGYGRRAMIAIAGTGVLLFAIGFLADRAWPVNYVRSLLGYQQDRDVASCAICAGLPAQVGRWLGLSGITGAFVVGIAILCVLTAAWLLTRRRALHDPEMLISVAALVVLLSGAYLLKYDFILLLVPLAVLAGKPHRAGGWVLLAVIFALPLLTLLLSRTQGDLVLAACAAMLLVMLYRAKPLLDVSRAGA